MRKRWTVTILTLGTLGSSGCVAWRVQTAPPAEVVADPKVEVVKVTQTNQTELLVYQPRVANDTLTGLPTELAIQKVSIPVSDITSVATRYRHIGKTLLAALAIGGGLLVYTLLQGLNQGF
ncbi:MAG: hypothetical protein AB7R55_20115 [Gemmatimonadales bacterium]